MVSFKAQEIGWSKSISLDCISILYYQMSRSFLIQVNLDMTDHCMTDFCIWWTVCLVPVWCISSFPHMYTTDFACDGPIFLVPLSLSYPSSPVLPNVKILFDITWIYHIHSQLKRQKKIMLWSNIKISYLVFGVVSVSMNVLGWILFN